MIGVLVGEVGFVLVFSTRDDMQFIYMRMDEYRKQFVISDQVGGDKEVQR